MRIGDTVSALSLIAAEILSEQALEVRLLNDWGREVSGSGYPIG